MSDHQLNVNPISSWIPFDKKPLIISGPCSAETEEQLVNTGLALKKLGKVDAIRAGIWKPRTRPNSFEGNGTIALPWIKSVKEATGLPFATEVATPQHIDEALKYGADILWIGARSTVNPFTVQEMADALRGVDVPVLIKNPINPELQLWIGAIERIYNAGIRNVAATHRGFSTHQKTKYRNAPLWQIPIELKTIFPSLPIIGDPSHITGKRTMIFETSQRALDLNYDGLMIECHLNPDKAWSDAAQQVTPDALEQIISALRIREATSDDALFVNHLEELRHKIDDSDRELLEVIATRMSLVEKLGEYKKDHNVAIFQVERWNEVFKSRPEWAERMNIHKDFVAELFKLIHLESIRKQTEVVERENVQ
jgi:chorismate mutase